MKFPLLLKILGCFFLNLLVLAAVAAYFLWQDLGPVWIFPNSSRVRVQAMSEILTGELSHLPIPDWSAVLDRFSKAYGFQFALYDRKGKRLTNHGDELPADALEALRQLPRPVFSKFGTNQPAADVAFNISIPFPAVVVHSSSSIWLLVELSGIISSKPSTPFILGGSTDSLASSSLLFDPTPWFVALGIILILSALAWVPLVRSLTRAIAQMTLATETIAAGQFQISVDERRRDELGRLGGAINRMAGRLDALLRGQKRFLADVAHELCSPLARLEVALSILEQRSGAELEPRVRDAQTEVREMSDRVNELLDFSKAGLRRDRDPLETIPLAALADAIIHRENGEGFDIRDNIPADLSAKGVPDLLARALANVFRNAFRYAGASGPIILSGEKVDEAVVLKVRDHGPGVPPETLPHLFDAFYRPDPARSRKLGGTGLGLAIVRSCVEACHGSVTARNHPEGGFEVCLILPPG